MNDTQSRETIQRLTRILNDPRDDVTVVVCPNCSTFQAGRCTRCGLDIVALLENTRSYHEQADREYRDAMVSLI